jgi:tripartite-type tricarboxylate transporter receptor subunit TctC
VLGGASDITARLIGQWLSERVGQQFVIDSRPGCGSNIGTEAVVRTPVDGYTLLMVGAFNAINPTLYDELNSILSAIAPVAGIILVPNLMVLNPSVSAKTSSRAHRTPYWRGQRKRPTPPRTRRWARTSAIAGLGARQAGAAG